MLLACLCIRALVLFTLPWILCTMLPIQDFNTAPVRWTLSISNSYFMNIAPHPLVWMLLEFLWSHRKPQSLRAGATRTHRGDNVPVTSITIGGWDLVREHPASYTLVGTELQYGQYGHTVWAVHACIFQYISLLFPLTFPCSFTSAF